MGGALEVLKCCSVPAAAPIPPQRKQQLSLHARRAKGELETCSPAELCPSLRLFNNSRPQPEADSARPAA